MSRAREQRSVRSPHRLPPGARIACAVSTYHEDVTGEMLASALETLGELGVEREEVLVVPCPGAFELPLVARRLARRKDVVAVLCFGLVLKGETEHDRYISEACAHGLTLVALETDTPVLFGVLTCANLEQARERARRESAGGLDKGREVALAALEALAALRAADAGAKKGSAKRAR
jgi:6,7-dimethyl-8-ribityllumazine synthase